MVDNPSSPLSAQEKLSELLTRQENWLGLKPRVTEELVIEGSTSVYEMQEGMFLWCPRERPEKLAEEVQLWGLPMGEPGLRKRVDMAFRSTGRGILDVHLDPTQDLLILSEAL
jgi:hypothetical protein